MNHVGHSVFEVPMQCPGRDVYMRMDLMKGLHLRCGFSNYNHNNGN